ISKTAITQRIGKNDDYISFFAGSKELLRINTEEIWYPKPQYRQFGNIIYFWFDSDAYASTEQDVDIESEKEIEDREYRHDNFVYIYKYNALTKQITKLNFEGERYTLIFDVVNFEGEDIIIGEKSKDAQWLDARGYVSGFPKFDVSFTGMTMFRSESVILKNHLIFSAYDRSYSLDLKAKTVKYIEADKSLLPCVANATDEKAFLIRDYKKMIVLDENLNIQESQAVPADIWDIQTVNNGFMLRTNGSHTWINNWYQYSEFEYVNYDIYNSTKESFSFKIFGDMVFALWEASPKESALDYTNQRTGRVYYSAKVKEGVRQ
ncbi:MAG: hypothetical protein LBS74_04010, partial [Oscillospiraceae bacterium]|nr:hypothetical protein [Oscillospiraceae bacterium]